jgi:N-acetylmuramic acid 6-phosphate etherase
MVLNMITTTAMIRLGKVYGNYMIDHQAINANWWIAEPVSLRVTGLNYDEAYQALLRADKHVKEAVVMVKLGLTWKKPGTRLKLITVFSDSLSKRKTFEISNL